MVDLKRYKCFKQVSAMEIGDIEEVSNGGAIFTDIDRVCSVCVDQEYMQKHKPQVGGYFVQYEDDYQSFSPAKAFEEGYTLIEEDDISA